VLVVGLARTGVATALFCAARGANVMATRRADRKTKLGEAIAPLRTAGVKLELGGHRENTFLEQDLIIPSPGVSADAPLLQARAQRGVTIASNLANRSSALKNRSASSTSRSRW